MEIIATIAGGFIAAITGWFVQTRIEASRTKRLKKLLILGITDDLDNSLDLYDQLTENWERSQVVLFNLLTEVLDSRHVYVNNRDSIVLINDTNLRNKIFQYYRKSGNHLLNLQSLQQRKYDIDNKFKLALQDQRLRNPQLPLDQAQDLVFQTMSGERDEWAYYDKQIPALISGIQRFKNDAKDIREALKNEI